MRRQLSTAILSVAAAAVLLTPARANADLFFFISGGELAVEFGLLPFQVDDDLHDSFSTVGSANLLSGPLLDLDVDAINGLTKYSYGPGTLTLALTLEAPDQTDVTGTFTAVTSPFEFTVCEGCDVLFGNGRADDFEIAFGSGEFDAVFAQAMGFARTGHTGFIDFGLEDIDGGPASDLRTGFDHRGLAPLTINVVEAPEPASAWLVLTAGAAWLVRRRSRKA